MNAMENEEHIYTDEEFRAMRKPFRPYYIPRNRMDERNLSRSLQGAARRSLSDLANVYLVVDADLYNEYLEDQEFHPYPEIWGLTEGLIKDGCLEVYDVVESEDLIVRRIPVKAIVKCGVVDIYPTMD